MRPLYFSSRGAPRKTSRRASQGQAVIEYVLMLTVSVSMALIIAAGFRKALFRFWDALGKDIIAACPGCPPNPKYRLTR